MIFTIQKVSGELDISEINIDNVQDLLDIMDKYNEEIIISYGDEKIPHITIYNDYVE